ncbi:GroES-like protein [Dacryopinax primogenitus]|uniref:GroES-like protein n=1 Tax=Dacryopinax primogenitus (strain DJM 731) TaxID=1858805 RepID=M5GFP8_DACPD|nr:GroES-like protein [Dacryopinax primogenitus]EJU06497.1 GroES-like protein [Dacryopinax primogenitus]
MTEILGNNKSFVLRGVNDVVFEEKPIPILAPDEVLIQIKKTGICGSDVHFLTHGHIGDFHVRSPMVLGHESSGLIHSVGSSVRSLHHGQAVALEPGVSCRRCGACKAGRYQLCDSMVFAATPPMEPLSVAVHAASNISRITAGQTVCVFGCGPVGLLCMAVSRALGASTIVAVDIQPARLEFARKYAATHVFLPLKPEEGESRIAHSRRCAEGICALMGWDKDLVKGVGLGGTDTVLEATGAESCIQTGVYVARRGGVFTQIGMGAENITLPITTALVKELQIRGSFRYGYGDYPLAIAFASAHKIDLKPLVTHRYKFEDAVEAFESTKNGKDKDGKWVIKTLIDGPE